MNAPNSPPNGEVCPRCGKPELEAARSDIQELEQQIAALEAENAVLTASANMFADLAERLNIKLRDTTANS